MLFLHVGLIKTGTTTLQRSVFNKVGINSFGQPSIPDAYMPLPRLREYVERHRTNGIDLVSLEALAQIREECAPAVPESLKCLNPDKIIITVRDPIRWIYSLQGHYLTRGRPPEYFESWLRQNKFFYRHLHWPTVKSWYVDVYGAENVGMFHMDEADFSTYAENILRWMGIQLPVPPVERMNATGIPTRLSKARIIGRFIPERLRTQRMSWKIPPDIEREIREATGT